MIKKTPVRLLIFLALSLLVRIEFAQGQPGGMPLHTQSEKAKNLFFKAADMQRTRRFDLAIEALEEAIQKDKTFEEAYAMLIKDYELFGMNKKLAAVYALVLKHLPEHYLASKAYLAQAETHFQTKEFNQAEAEIEKAIQLSGQDLALKTKAMQLKQNIKFVAGYAINETDSIELEPFAESFNRFPLQYFPAMTADENFLIFTARMGTHESYDENIYVSRKMDGHWVAPQPLSPNINSRENEGTSSINADARLMVFTKCNDPRGQGSCDIFYTERVGNQWKEPKPLTAINSPSWDSHPSISSDGRTLFFTSGRPGGQGRMDLWCAEKDTNGNWQPPYNLGPTVNTPFDEETPFIHANNQTLYFASDGHPGFGKVDLYYTQKKNGLWQKPKNLGGLINSARDESGLFITASGKTGLFCIEDRVADSRELLASQIRMFHVPKSMQVGNKCTFLTGTTYDAQTKKRIQATVEIVDLQSGKVEFSMPSDQDIGTYMAILQLGKNYGMFVSKPGYLFQSLVVQADSSINLETGIKKDIELEPIRSGASIVLNNIFFESGKADLLPASLVELRKVSRLLQTNPALKIEISGHTDDVGSDAANQLLSQKRAFAVTENLTRQGIAKTRLVAKGYGETKSLNDNASEEKRQLNRRIEFKVL